MAIGAERAQRTLVGIVLFVASIARTGGFAVEFSGYMALVTKNLLVLAFQRVIREFVVEPVLVQYIYTGIQALVFGMTVAASLGFHFSMKAGVGINVHAGFFVAIQAALILPLAIKLYVTLGAVVFVFRVCTRELAWGHDGLYALSNRPWRECNQK